MACIRAWMSSKFGQIRPGTTELAALEHLKIDVAPFFLDSQLWLYLGYSQVSVYMTIGPLVVDFRWPTASDIRISRQFSKKLFLHYLFVYLRWPTAYDIRKSRLLFPDTVLTLHFCLSPMANIEAAFPDTVLTLPFCLPPIANNLRH